MTILRSDNFDRADNTSNPNSPSDGGSDWVVGAGVWGINGNALYKPRSSNFPSQEDDTIWLECGTPIVTIEVVFSAFAAGDAQIAFRIVDAANYLVWIVQNSTGGGIYKRQAGTFSQLARFPVTIAPCTLRVTADVSNQIFCYQDGALKGSVTSYFNTTATKHGFDFFLNDDSRADSFTVSDMATPATNLPGQIWL